MTFFTFVVAFFALLQAVPSSASTLNTTSKACITLKSSFEGQVFFPGNSNYTAENEHFWTPTNYLSPGCVFLPQTTLQLSRAIPILQRHQAKFAVRSGGHMPIPGFANIIDGVLIGLTRLNQLRMSSNKSYVSVGPGRRWEEVYDYLDSYGLVALGGRVGLVGVPGLLLGGGISFYSNQHGFASDNVIAFEVVLASGKIVTATSTQHADLFWALKGGGNSFGIVTRFDLQTFSSPSICAGIVQIAAAEKERFLSAVADYGQYGSADVKSAVIPSIFILASLNLTIYTSALFYDGNQCEQPSLSNFTAIPAIATTYAPTTLAAYVAGTDILIGDGTRQAFRVVSSYATRTALDIVHNTFVDMVAARIADVAGLQASVAFQPITKNFIQQGIHRGGNPQGVDITKAPYFWMVQNFSWSDVKDDIRIYAFADEVTQLIEERLAAVGQLATYRYMNDAGFGQQIFQNYGPGNLEKLQSIRQNYDPLRVYTDLMPGGWKVDDV
ncbi:Bifunctional solanapyrone synthase 4 [Phlyctema vagabunda]|uniref:Bifunctional solanapyrone synthase 4 n=1 Tax=Phlyctema vagabunda TaxID=108571 RepID=A0ABR4PS89_9HELO